MVFKQATGRNSRKLGIPKNQGAAMVVFMHLCYGF